MLWKLLWKPLFGIVGFIAFWAGLALMAKGYAIPAVASWAITYFTFSVLGRSFEIGGN